MAAAAATTETGTPVQDCGDAVIVNGAGLCGALLALQLARRGHRVELFELRPDMRRDAAAAAGRSINLALSARGLAALEAGGVAPAVRAMCIPMRGRMLHAKPNSTKAKAKAKEAASGDDDAESTGDGRGDDDDAEAQAEAQAEALVREQLYSRGGQHAILSVSRAGINAALLDACEATTATTGDVVAGSVRLHFGHKLVGLRARNRVAEFEVQGTGEVGVRPNDRVAFRALAVLGADGAHSATRAQLQRTPRFDLSIRYLHVGYKELHIPPAEVSAGADSDAKFRISKNHLHIWPRGPFMVIALPNLDGSFTVTCFWPHEGPTGFDVLDNAPDQAVRDFFAEEFPDALPHMPTLLEDFRANPTSGLATVRCGPWSVANGGVTLLGDAAHAIVPFFGQGMNASFEDVSVLMGCLDEFGCKPTNTSAADAGKPGTVDRDAWGKALTAFGARRKDDADAIADMAIENFYEMASKTADQAFLARKHVDHWLGNTFEGRFSSRYELVSFSTIPYRRAYDIGRVTAYIANELLRGINVDDVRSEEDAARLCDAKRAEELIDTLLPKNLLGDFDAPIPGLEQAAAAEASAAKL